MFFDPLYFIIVGPAIVLVIWAQAKVKAAFGRFSRVQAASRMTGAQVARALLDTNGLTDVTIEPIDGDLADHYDPRQRVLRLSPAVYQGQSLAALGVAAHETGHALQDASGYVPLKLRASLVPAFGFGTNLGPILIILGIFLSARGSLLGYSLANLGLLVFAAAVVFQLVTLPVELNASSRAMRLLSDGGYIQRDEYGPTRQVLNAAALTYLAAALAAVLQLIYFLLLSQRRR